MSVDLKFDFEEALSRNPDFKIEDLVELRKWVEEQDPSSLIPKDINDKQLLLFYNACLLNLDNTKKCMKVFYTMRNNTPEYFDNRHLDDELMQKTVDTFDCFILSNKTDEGYDIFYNRFNNVKPEDFHPSHLHKLYFMTIEAFLYEQGPPKGFVVMFDVGGYKLGHMKRVPLSLVMKLVKYLQEAIPINLKRIYILNANSILDNILSFIKPFTRKELYDLLFIHRYGDDFDNFFKNNLNKRCILPDYGGESPDTKSLNEKNCQRINSTRDYFDAEEKHRHDYKEKVSSEPVKKRWYSLW